MQPGKLAWLPGPPFSLPTGDLGSLPTSRRGENPLLVTVQQPRPIAFSLSFCKSVYFLSERGQATGAPSPVPASPGWNGHKTMVRSRRAARLRRCEGIRRSLATASGQAPGPGRREDSESGPGRLRSAELTAARLARRPQTAQSRPQAAAPAGAGTAREGVPPQTARCGGTRTGTTAPHESGRLAWLSSARPGCLSPAASACPALRRPVHPSRGWLPDRKSVV